MLFVAPFINECLRYLQVIGLVRVKCIAIIYGPGLFNGFIRNPAVFVPELGIIGIPEPEPDRPVFCAHIHANVFILREGIVV